MCGIFGVVGHSSAEGLRAAAETLQHRGPDAFGEWCSPTGPVYFAHCRLAIIDLSPAGQQPLANEDGSVQVVFNGEIYNFAELRTILITRNHQFRSRTDTEVIVHAYEEWGDDCVQRFRGIFAFGLWDGNARRLLLARDRLGVKPLYYTFQNQQLAFASEPRAVLNFSGYGRTIHVPAALQFMQLSYTTGRDTIWKGIQRLPPAHVMTYDVASKALQQQVYWSLPKSSAPRSLKETIEQADSLLENSVDEELVSDVPVGVFLSGGIDSSLVTTYAAKASPHIKSFCVDFPGWIGSEAADSREVAEHLRTNHYVCSLDRPNSMLSNPDTAHEFFRTWDEPFGDTAIVPTWQLARQTREHVTVALSGDGGDELFAGYTAYQRVQSTLRRRAAWFVEWIRRQSGGGREWPEGCASDCEFYQMLHCPSFGKSELVTLFPDWQTEILRAEPGKLFESMIDRNASPLRRWQMIDMQTYLVDNNLARVDRASMAHGLEVRVPMLDHRLVEFAFSLADQVCYRDRVSKLVLRELSKRYLPSKVANKRKQGFSFPLDQVVSREEMRHLVCHGVLSRHGVLDRSAFEKWASTSTSSNLDLKMWLLYVFEQWASCWWLND